MMSVAIMLRFMRALVLMTALFKFCEGRKHVLPLWDDERPVIVVTSFGYLEGGYLEVNITNLKITQTSNPKPLIGFSFDKSSSSGTSSYVEREESTRGCVLVEDSRGETFEDVPRAILKIDLEHPKSLQYKLTVKERLMKGLKFYGSKAEYEASVKSETNSSKADEDKKGGSETGEETKTSDEKIKSSEDDTKDDSKPKGEAETEAGDIKETSSTPKVETIKSEPPVTPKTNPSRRRRAAVTGTQVTGKDIHPAEKTGYINQGSLPILGNYDTGMNFSFYVRIETKEQIGLYELYFHNCHNSDSNFRDKDVNSIKVAFTASIVEKNANSFLSAGDMALPTMYGVISVMFFIAGIVWIRLICCTTDERVFKIHYLMAVIIMIKGLSVLFHSLDYFFIAKDGRTEAWAVIYYIVHLLKGILLIICLLLIGTGWAFIKYILSDRDKKLFMIVIPMQVMVNIAYIIMEETEEGNKSYYTWKNIVILVDVLCCGAILIPVVWSIRHLQEASQTDGKAAINLAKLELFRHFYIMVVCYLYFTRIIVYLLEITLPFQYIWIHALFSELGALVFFSVTGYKFRPGCDNPYLKLDQYDSDEDPEEAITQSGVTETLTRVNKREKDVEEVDEFDVLIPKQRTSKV